MKKEPALSRELADLALVLMKIIKREFKSESGPGVPTLTQFRMLHVVRRGVTGVGKLAELFGISQPAASIMVETMVKDGLLKRTPHPVDRRQVELRLTPKAAARLDAILGRAFKKIDARLEALPSAEKKALARGARAAARLLSGPEAA
jgi:DNA-binding MarR family transcriptional regulator